MADSDKESSIGGTFVKCAGQGVVDGLAYPLDSVTGAIGNVAGFLGADTTKSKLLSGSFFSDLADNKYEMLVGLDKKNFSAAEKLSCDAGNLVGETAAIAVPGTAAFKAIKLAEKGSKTLKVVGKTLATTEGVNFGFDLKNNM